NTRPASMRISSSRLMSGRSCAWPMAGTVSRANSSRARGGREGGLESRMGGILHERRQGKELRAELEAGASRVLEVDPEAHLAVLNIELHHAPAPRERIDVAQGQHRCSVQPGHANFSLLGRDT